ncbi:hypothetical protein HYS48_03880 [Candidatus Woesearchaeota archaeon]|nr:hypothetical protein [Candidatus Woesearchaeota archaeon]
MKNQTIHVIITGGTIDSFYDGIKETVVPHEHSIIPNYLKGLRIYDQLTFSEVCMKDSREITEKDL